MLSISLCIATIVFCSFFSQLPCIDKKIPRGILTSHVYIFRHLHVFIYYDKALIVAFD